MPSAWMNENETFAAWLAHEKGWDKEEGIDLEINYFNSGMDIVNATPSNSWVVAGNGAVPAVWGALRYDSYVIAIGNDESYTNGVLVRPDSPSPKSRAGIPTIRLCSASGNRARQDVSLHYHVLAAHGPFFLAKGSRPHGQGRDHQKYGSAAGPGRV